MTSPAFSLECSNPVCLHAENQFGQRLCRACRKPLAYRYLWAVGKTARHIPPGTVVGDRYMVMAPQVWLDRTPGRSPHFTSELGEAGIPAVARPYLELFDAQLHLPQVYDIYVELEEEPGYELDSELDSDLADPAEVEDWETLDWETLDPILLLEQGPLDPGGHLHTLLSGAWSQAPAVRQVSWLWQMLQLWTPLVQAGVATSLLLPDNLHVEGWRVQLRELHPDTERAIAPTLADLGTLWHTWIDAAQPQVKASLREVCRMMQSVPARVPVAAGSEEGWASDPVAVPHSPADALPVAIAQRLNRILLEQASQQPLTLAIAGATTTGPQRTHNEDACYPQTLNEQDGTLPDDLLLIPRLGIVCDGIGGHAGGEVASQLAVRSLKLQICALFTELAEQGELFTPDLIAQHLEAIVRVTNNLITSQNDAQERVGRQRMCTTLAMGVQIPQQILSPAGMNNAHELYVVNVGDSRAYWITARYCHQLTVDDDVASREVRLGRALYRQTPNLPNAEALTQALGTKEGEALHPHVRRFVVEEDGILLLCSDGLSDYGWVEAMWEHSSKLVLKGKMSLAAAVQSWLELANQRNGDDNTSVVMMLCRVGEPEPELLNFGNFDRQAGDRPQGFASDFGSDFTSDWSDASRALLDEETVQPEIATATAPRNRWSKVSLVVLGLALAGFVAGSVGIVAWRFLAPDNFQNTIDSIRPDVHPD
jgi:protein phosphatase